MGLQKTREVDSDVGDMTEQERNNYNYLYNTQGKEQAEEYAQLIQNDIQKRSYDAMENELSDWYNSLSDGKRKAVGAAITIASPFVSSIERTKQTINTADTLLSGEGMENIHPYSEPYILGKLSDSAYQIVEERAIENAPSQAGKVFAKGAFDVINSTLGSRAGELIYRSPYTVIMGANSFAQQLEEASMRGESLDYALPKAAVNGAVETLSEILSIEALLPDTSAKELKDVFKKLVLVTGPVEGSEEFFGGIADNLFDDLWHKYVLKDEDSEYNQKANEYVMQGMPPEEAEKQAKKDGIKELLVQGVEGALSGWLGGGAAAGVYIANTANQGRQIRKQGNEQELYRAVEDNGSGDSYWKAKEYQEKTANGKRVSNFSLGMLQQNAIEDTVNRANAGQKSIKDSTKVSLVEQYAARAKGDVKADGTLTDKGNKMVDLMGKAIEGKVSRSDLNTLRKSKAASDILNTYAAQQDINAKKYENQISYIAKAGTEGYHTENSDLSAERKVQLTKPTLKSTEGGLVSLSNIESEDNGKLTATLSNGKTEEIQLSDIKDVNARELWKNGVKYGAEFASGFVEGFDGGSISKYTSEYGKAYQMAATGMDLPLLKRMSTQLGLELSDKAIESAFESGVASIANKGGFVNLSTNTKNKFLNDQISIIKDFADNVKGVKDNVTVVVADDLYRENNGVIQKIAGKANRDKGIVFVSVNDSPKKVLTRVVGHEMYHVLEGLDIKNGTKYASDLKTM